MVTPIVSVVMPVYNGSRYLREAMDSILNQTFTDFELLVVNDGSTDDSEDIVLSYNDARICYLKNERNSGICVTLNKGLDNARGKYIARMDCDDVSMPNRLEKQVDYLECHPEVGAIGSDIVTFSEGHSDIYFNFVHDKAECKAGLLIATCFAHPVVMLRSSIVNEHHLRYDDTYRGLEDFELWYRLSKYTELTNLPEALIRYRLHKGQATQNVTKQVSDKEEQFLRQRFLYYFPFTEKQLQTAANYVFNRWGTFDDSQILDLMNIFSQIIRSKKVRENKSFKRAMQITLSKAFVYTCSMSSGIKSNRIFLYTKAFINGIVPFDWFCKFVYNEITKR